MKKAASAAMLGAAVLLLSACATHPQQARLNAPNPSGQPTSCVVGKKVDATTEMQACEIRRVMLWAKCKSAAQTPLALDACSRYEPKPMRQVAVAAP